MNILFLTIAWPEYSERNIYTDLMEEFKEAGHSVYVVATRERRVGKPTEHAIENGMHILRIKSGNITQTNYFEKGVSSILLGYQMRAAIIRYFNDVGFDLIIYSTPPITIANTVKKLKRSYNANTYLLLKDIWPHDIAGSGVIKKGGLIWHYFRQKEKLIYRVSDYIGCMSPANIQYVLKYNTYLDPEKVEECPNCIKPTEQKRSNRTEIRKKYGIPDTSTVFIFGGNLGKPQGVNFLLDAAGQMTGNEKVFFLVIGSGTEYSKIKNRIEKESISNVLLLERLPKEEYEELVRASDVGLILLDRHSVIPNFPSRLLSYLDIGLPVLCSTYDVCDMGDIVEEWNCGIKTLHGDLDSFTIAVNKLASNKNLRINMSKHSRELLEEKYTAKQGYKTIMKHFEG
jgi:glycosyltransferase involved in cell wall biosynthesis